MRTASLLSGLCLLARLALASPLIDENLQSGVFKREELEHFKRQEEELAAEVDKVRPPSCHTPTNRACWSPGFDINTNWYEKTPNTGVTRKYYLELTEHDNWIAGDGHKKEKAMLINGKFPGPTLVGNWGDWMEVRVTNKMTTNGTSIHWHGIHFRKNNVNDGANGITECPLPPGASKTYRFRVEQYGTGWFHSHFSSQYSNGVVGTLIFYGPASLPYEEDLGVFPISDWYWKSAEKIFYEMIDPNQEFPGDNPDSNNVLFNGKHTNVEDGKGSYYRVKLKKGRRHRLRIINTSVDNSFTVSLVNHKMTVIQTDYVPVNAYTADSIFVSIGQRYDVIIDANQPVGNYWFNVTYSKNFNCGETKAGFPAAIFDYEGADTRKLPTIQGGPVEEHLCQDKIDYKPIVPIDVPKPAFQASGNNTLSVNFTFMPWEGKDRIYWTVNKQDLNVSWEQPTLKYLAEGKTEFPQRYNTILEPEANVWSFWVIENLTPISHPMHLHGHDLFVLGHSDPPEKPLEVGMTHFDPVADLPRLRFDNPARRDVIHLPSMGWSVVAFKTDNPGVWLFHCHISWHAGQGLSVQVVERASEIPKNVNLAELEPTCAQWKKWSASSPYKQVDSGV